MPDLTTTHLKCLLEKATPGPWEYKLEEGCFMDDLVEILNGWIQTGDGETVLGAGLEINDDQELQNLALAALAPDLAQEVIRLREQVKGLILAMETKAATGESQSPAVIAGFLKEIVLGEPNG